MKKLVSILLFITMLLLLCSCDSANSQDNVPYMDSDFITSFPFTAELLSDAATWVAQNDNYEVKETDVLNNELILRYKPNKNWENTAIRGADGVYGINGFYVIWVYLGDLDKVESEAVYQAIVDELTDICGNYVNVYTHDNGENKTFSYGELSLKVKMYHHSDSTELTVEMCCEE